MDKISSILPATARVTTVDLKNSGVARPGSPAFGREVGVPHAVQRMSQDELTSTRANQLRNEQAGVRNKVQDPKAQIVQKMAENFFNTKAKTLSEEAKQVPSEFDEMRTEMPKDEMNFKSEEVGSKFATKDVENLMTQNIKAEGHPSEAEEESLAVGRYLDVQA